MYIQCQFYEHDIDGTCIVCNVASWFVNCDSVSGEYKDGVTLRTYTLHLEYVYSRLAIEIRKRNSERRSQ